MLARIRTHLSRFLLLGVMGAALSAPLWSQCVMCKESARYQRAGVIDAINRGIIVLAVPPLAIAVGIVCLTYRYRNSSTPGRLPDEPETSA